MTAARSFGLGFLGGMLAAAIAQEFGYLFGPAARRVERERQRVAALGLALLAARVGSGPVLDDLRQGLADLHSDLNRRAVRREEGSQ